MSEVWLILGMFAITFTIRFIMFAIAGKVVFPLWMQQCLKFVPPAVLTAIIVPMAVMPQGQIDFSLSNIYLIAAVISFFISLITNNLLTTISLGMSIFLLLRFFTL